MTDKENYLRAVRFEYPDHIPMAFAINTSCWEQYPQDALFQLKTDKGRSSSSFLRTVRIFLHNLRKFTNKIKKSC